MSFHSLSSGYTGAGSNSFLSMPRADDSARNTAPPAPRETKGLPDEPRTAQQLIEHCLDAHAQASSGPLSDADELRVTATIRSLLQDCLNGAALDLRNFGQSSLPGEYPTPSDVPVLHPDAWAQLDGYVRAREGHGITDANIAQLAHLDSVAAGLARMSDLGYVTFTAPEREPDAQRLIVDLQKLQPGHPEKLTVCVNGDVSNLLVKVPAHALAHANGTNDPAHIPSVVEYFDSKSGEPLGPLKMLAGTVWAQASWGFDQNTASKLNLNGDAKRLVGEFAPHPLPQPDDQLKCHSLCMVWAMAQNQKILDGKAGDESSAFDRGQSIKQGISAGYTDEAAKEEYGMMTGARAEALFDLDNFGPMVAQQLEQLQPGQTQWFFFNSPGHAMVLELSWPEQASGDKGHTQYGARLFDPNRSVQDHCMVAPDTESFARIPISAWLTPHEQREYFPSQPRAGTLIRWTPPQEREGAVGNTPGTGPRLHVNPAHIGSAAFLMAAMDSHAPDCVTRSIEAILDTKGDALDRVEMLCATDRDGRSPLIWAGARNQPDNVIAYVRGILAAPTDRLSMHDKLWLLKSEDPHSGHPFLGHLAALPSDCWPEDAMHAYCREIASSSLALQDKGSLLAGENPEDRNDPPETAAQLALYHAPGRVLAMACGILDAQLPASESLALFEVLDVDSDALSHAIEGKLQRLHMNPNPLAQEEIQYLLRWCMALEKASGPD